jgi:hypothetical protein
VQLLVYAVPALRHIPGSMVHGHDLEMRIMCAETHCHLTCARLICANGCMQVVLPRPAPRITADRLQRHLEEALADIPAD